eukprot:scaffold34635_cov208-Amphora_coffeaeformis.AAC.3
MTDSGISRNQSNCDLPPVAGFTLTRSAYSNPNLWAPSASASPLGPPTPEERRRHLLHVLECAMAILDDEDHEDMPPVNVSVRRGDEDPSYPGPSLSN